MSAETVVIVGASHASVQAIDTLRREGHAGRDRPGRRRTVPAVQPAAAVEEIPFGRTGARAAAAARRRSSTSRRRSKRGSACGSPRSIAPTSACGSTTATNCTTTSCCCASAAGHRLLEVPGYDLGGIHYLRTMADVDGIRDRPCRREQARGRRRRLHRARGGGVGTAPGARRDGPRNGGSPDEPGRRARDVDASTSAGTSAKACACSAACR